MTRPRHILLSAGMTSDELSNTVDLDMIVVSSSTSELL